MEFRSSPTRRRCVRLVRRPRGIRGAGWRRSLISPGVGFIKSRRYQRLPRTSAARPDLMRR